jgi:hypothetical protein
MENALDVASRSRGFASVPQRSISFYNTSRARQALATKTPVETVFFLGGEQIPLGYLQMDAKARRTFDLPLKSTEIPSPLGER